MWLMLAALGGILGSASGALVGVLLGGLVGHLMQRVNTLTGRVAELERRDRQAALAAPPLAAPPLTVPPRAPEPEAPPAPAPVAAPLPAAAEPSAPHETVSPPRLPPRPDAPDDQPTRRNPPPQPPTLDPQAWLARLLSGNLLAKLGIVLLFFGVASGLKLAAEQGLMPPGMRLLAAALAGLACIWAGASPATGGPLRPAWLGRFSQLSETARAGLGFALEGGGFGLLYLSVYFALARYGYLTPATAFPLFAGLGLACITLALRQNGQALALLGLSGAFLAPALAGGDGSHRILFAYMTLLDVVILWASLGRGWRALVQAGFVFTLVLGLAWADTGYRPELRPEVAAFVTLVLALFSLTPVLAARRGETVAAGWRAASLLFGPPAAAAAAWAALFDGAPSVLALASLAAGLWYGLLWHLARRTDDELLTRALAGLAVAILSLAPYLAFSQNTAGVFWALEGAGLVWFARRADRLPPLAAGLLLQALSGLLLFDLWTRGPDGLPFRNSLFHASLLLVAAGLASTFFVRDLPRVARLALAWSLAWWFGAWYWELGYTLSEDRRQVAMLLLASVTFLAMEWAGRRWALADARRASLLLLPATLGVLALVFARAGHPLGEGLWLVLPLAFLVLYVTLRRQETDGLDAWLRERHVLLFWALAWIPAWEVHWQASQAPALGFSVPEALRGVLLALPALLLSRRMGFWPVAAHRALYSQLGMMLPLALAWAWLLTWPATLTGRWALPWAPLLNPLELAALFLLWTLYRHWRDNGEFGRAWGYPALFPLALLVWLSTSLARLTHHWTGVPYLARELWLSDLSQTLWSLSWTAFAIGAMVLASRRGARLIWFGGLGLLCVVGLKLLLVDLAHVGGVLRVLSLMGIGLLVLGAGHLAPVPPRRREAGATPGA